MNPYKQALTEPLHLLTAATLAALAPAFGDPLPLFLLGGGEAIYLLYMPQSRWYTALNDRRAIAALQKARERCKRQILTDAPRDTRDAFVRMERFYSGVVSENAAISPDFCAAYERLFLQYLRLVEQESAFDRYLAGLAVAAGVTNDVRGTEQVERIIARSQEQVAWFRELLYAATNAPDASVADASRQIAEMEERIVFTETVTRFRAAVVEEKRGIECLFEEITPNASDVAATVEANVKQFLNRLTVSVPKETRVAALAAA